MTVAVASCLCVCGALLTGPPDSTVIAAAARTSPAYADRGGSVVPPPVELARLVAITDGAALPISDATQADRLAGALPDSRGPRVAGRPDGVWVLWHPGAAVGALGSYRAGVRHGPWGFAWPEGTKRAFGRYDAGRPDGLWIEWYPTGFRSRAVGYRLGRPDGPWTEWWPDGRLAREGRYTLGRRVGTWSSWRSNGTLLESGSFADDLREGRWREFFPDGRLAIESHWVGGVRHGPWREWAPEGTLLGEGWYEHGKRQGRWTFYGSDGHPLRHRSGIYEDGERVRG